MKTKKFIIFVGLAVIFGFLFRTTAAVFSKMLFIPATDAFLGAFFAFLFIRLGDFLKTIHDKIKRHHNALVRFQYMCNEYFNIIVDNISVVNNFAKLVEKTITTSIIPVYINRFHPFEIDKNILLDFQDIKLINEAFSFHDDLNRTNSDMANFTRFYNEMRQGMLQGNISREEYKYNIQNIVGEFKKVKNFFEYLDEKTERMVAISRCLLRDKFLKIFFKNKFPSEKELAKEIIKLQEERKKIQEDSKKEKEQIFNK